MGRKEREHQNPETELAEFGKGESSLSWEVARPG